jgi:4-amino-4-deoxy-L-arabinose transferase-like glycosyltransferase
MMATPAKPTLTTRWNKHKFGVIAVGIFALAFYLRLLYVEKTIIDRPLRADAFKYFSYAQNIVEKGIYSQTLAADPKPDGQVTPGYPLFLAAILKMSGVFEHAYKNILFIQAVMGGLTAVMVFGIGLIFLRFSLATTAAILTSISPHLVTAGSYLLTEVLFTFLMVAGLLVIAVAFRNPKTVLFLLASFIMGLAALVRPALLLFPIALIPLVVLYWKPPKGWLIALVLVLGLSMAWGPWLIWKHKNVAPNPELPGLGLSAFVFGTYPDLTYKDPRLKAFPYKEDPDYARMVQDSDFAMKTFLEKVSREPFVYLRWYLCGKPTMFWSWSTLVGYGDVYIYPIRTSLYETSFIADTTRQGMRILHPILIVMAFGGLVISLANLRFGEETKHSQLVGLMLFSLMLYFTLAHSLLAPLPRYSIPLRPILYLCALFPLEFLLSQRLHTKLE